MLYYKRLCWLCLRTLALFCARHVTKRLVNMSWNFAFHASNLCPDVKVDLDIVGRSITRQQINLFTFILIVCSVHVSLIQILYFQRTNGFQRFNTFKQSQQFYIFLCNLCYNIANILLDGVKSINCKTKTNFIQTENVTAQIKHLKVNLQNKNSQQDGRVQTLETNFPNQQQDTTLERIFV